MKKKECSICVSSLLFMCSSCKMCNEDMVRKPIMQNGKTIEVVK